MVQNKYLQILGQELYDESIYWFNFANENDDNNVWHDFIDSCEDESNEIKDALTALHELLWKNQSINQIFNF
jgi:hypothetical protein